MTNELIKDIIQWDVKSWSTALNYWDKNVDWTNVHDCLELGGREGGLSVWLAQKEKQTICSDLAGTSATAEPLQKKYNIHSFVKNQDIDATNIPYENRFDIIVFKSILGGIGRDNAVERQKQAIDQVYKALRKGGKLLFAENLIASSLHQLLRQQFIKWGNSWRYVSLSEMHEFFKRFSYLDIKATGLIATFGRTESQRNVLAIIDRILLNKICPDNWKYIAYGIAEK